MAQRGRDGRLGADRAQLAQPAPPGQEGRCTVTGRFDTEQEAWQAGAEVRGGVGTETRVRHITSSLTADGVAMGRYDVAIARWLARWEPETVAVVLSWAERAYTAGRQTAQQRQLPDAPITEAASQ